MAKEQLNLEALKKALDDDGIISPEERDYLIIQGIPDLLLEALADGVLDDEEIEELTDMGVPEVLIEALRYGEISPAEIADLRANFADDMKKWRDTQLKRLFLRLSQE